MYIPQMKKKMSESIMIMKERFTLHTNQSIMTLPKMKILEANME
jgi:hypothetical protein